MKSIVKIVYPSDVTHVLAAFTYLFYVKVNPSTLTAHHKHISIAGTCEGNHQLIISSIFTYKSGFIFFSYYTTTPALLNTCKYINLEKAFTVIKWMQILLYSFW